VVIQPYDDSHAEMWDGFIVDSASGTILHTRNFLSYHQNRFDDRSLIVFDEKQKILAVLPAAMSPADKSVVVTHPGASFGGIVGSEKCRGETMQDVLSGIGKFYRDQKIERLLYKAVPFIYHRMPMQDDLYALFRMKAVRYRCDISAVVDLDNRGRIGSRRMRGFKKAIKAGLRIESGAQYAAPLWDVLFTNLQNKHGVKPVHSLEEITLLLKRFPKNIQIVVVLFNEQVEAGVVLFHSRMVSHAQYIASSERGKACNALDFIFEHCIDDAQQRGERYFDFGISNEDEGRRLNEGLYSFKCEYGAGGAVHEFYELDLLGIE